MEHSPVYHLEVLGVALWLKAHYLCTQSTPNSLTQPPLPSLSSISVISYGAQSPNLNQPACLGLSHRSTCTWVFTHDQKLNSTSQTDLCTFYFLKTPAIGAFQSDGQPLPSMPLRLELALPSFLSYCIGSCWLSPSGLTPKTLFHLLLFSTYLYNSCLPWGPDLSSSFTNVFILATTTYGLHKLSTLIWKNSVMPSHHTNKPQLLYTASYSFCSIAQARTEGLLIIFPP